MRNKYIWIPLISGSQWEMPQFPIQKALCGVLINRVVQIIPWIWSHIRSWTEDLASGSSGFDWKDGILPSHLKMPPFCAEEVLCFLKDREKWTVITCWPHQVIMISTLHLWAITLIPFQQGVKPVSERPLWSLFLVFRHILPAPHLPYSWLDGLQAIRLAASIFALTSLSYGLHW